MDIHTYRTSNCGTVDLCEDCAQRRERAQSRVRPASWAEQLQRGEPTDLCQDCGAFVCESCEATVSGEDREEAEHLVRDFDVQRLCCDCAEAEGLLLPQCDECCRAATIETDDGRWCSEECREVSARRVRRAS